MITPHVDHAGGWELLGRSEQTCLCVFEETSCLLSVRLQCCGSETPMNTFPSDADYHCRSAPSMLHAVLLASTRGPDYDRLLMPCEQHAGLRPTARLGESSHLHTWLYCNISYPHHQSVSGPDLAARVTRRGPHKMPPRHAPRGFPSSRPHDERSLLPKLFCRPASSS